MASEDTLPAETLAAEAAPPAKWDRYELGEKLGEGGMGVVYRATDLRLGRDVAIKFIRGGNPALTMRLLREARAQARIDHPGVCRVYEVGEVAGRAYIALQLVAGDSLTKAAASMALDEKIAVMRDVAIAIHEAHRLGIVHRDLKPANILVERLEDGRWQPIVMDFGLAREATLEVGLTETGALMGTPAYMSPEQARGDLRTIDRRSDIYSLGATLYEMLVGRAPFVSESLAIALEQILHHEPEAPRKLIASLPVDLETIAVKCLHKDPALRYQSARALADDLTRYLDGEPIEGRRLSIRQRLGASVRKHRALYATGAVSTVAVLVASALGLRSYLISRDERERAFERTQLAQRLGQQAKDIEFLLHTTYQLPLHDTRPERAVVRVRMGIIAATPHDLGSLGGAVVHDALGRGHLALHEWSVAATELARAEEAGLDTPELHAARGRALGEQFHRDLEEARRSGPDKAWVANREKELERRLLTPAIEELERARGATDTSSLLEAMLALYRRDFANAKVKALDVARTTPWLYESKRLAADAAYAQAVAEVDRGNYDGARPLLDEASALYRDAIDAARSDSSAYEAAAEARLEHAEIDHRQNRQNRPSVAELTEATALIDNAIAVDPTRATALTTKAHILLLAWQSKAQDETAQLALLDAMADSAERATRIDAEDVMAWDALGNAHTFRGTFETYHNREPTKWWLLALEELGKALALRPNDPWVNNDIGLVHRWLAQAAALTRDPMPEYRAASAAFERATTIDPDYLFAWTNRVDVLAELAEYQVSRSIDPRDTVELALASGNRGLAIDPNYDMLLKWMADAELREAEFLLGAGADPSTVLTAARGYLDRANVARPRNMTTWWLQAKAWRFESAWLLAHTRDAPAAIQRGRDATAHVIELAPGSTAGWIERAELELLTGDLANARSDATKALLLDPEDELANLVGADIERSIAEHGHDVKAIAHGMKLVDQALSIEPQNARAVAVRSRLLELQQL